MNLERDTDRHKNSDEEINNTPEMNSGKIDTLVADGSENNHI